MILGIGTDIVEIDRVSKAIQKDSFLNKCFTQNEINLIKKKSPQTATGNFCAKEAFSKALGTGFRNFSLKDVEVLRDNLDKPYIILHNNAKNIFEKIEANSIYVSISHCKEYATAVVVIEK